MMVPQACHVMSFVASAAATSCNLRCGEGKQPTIDLGHSSAALHPYSNVYIGEAAFPQDK